MLDVDPLSFQAALDGFSRTEMCEPRRALEVHVPGLAAARVTADDLAAMSDEVTGMFAAVEYRQAFLV